MMNDIIYDFRESRKITLEAINGVFGDAFDVSINISDVSIEQVAELRKMIETFCRGE